MERIIVNEFLSFLQNKIDVLDELSLLQICASNFSESEIETGKTLLYESCGNGLKCISRKGDDKKKKNIKDVINVLKEVDRQAQPSFVAKDLNRLPPVTFDYVDVTRLLKDITLLKSELSDLKTKFTTEMEERRDSMRINAGSQNTVLVNGNINHSNSMTPRRRSKQRSPQTPALVPQANAEPVFTPTYRDIVVDNSVQPRQAKTSRIRRNVTGVKSANAAVLTSKNIQVPSNSTRVTTDITDTDNTPFTLVESKAKKKSRQISTRRTNMRGTLVASKIDVAESQSSIYVSRAKKTVTVSDIENHVRDMGEECISVEMLKQHNDTSFNSFKVVIISSKLPTFLNSDFWPAGLVYRRYWERRVKPTTSTNNE